MNVEHQLSRRNFIALGAVTAGLVLMPVSSNADEISDVAVWPSSSCDAFENGLSEVVMDGDTPITITYSIKDNCRIVELVSAEGEPCVISFDLRTGSMYADGQLAGWLGDGQGSPVDEPLSTRAAGEWTEFDRGWQSLTWVAGSSVMAVGALVSAAVGVPVSQIVLSSWDALNILVQSETSMDLLCIWEHYFTTTFQQTRVKCYYHAGGQSFGPFIWHFNNA